MISVVIPAYNRRDSVLALLADLDAQRGVEFEVIVVDDRSTDDTVEAVTARFPGTILLQQEVNGGPAVARNRGVQAARGATIVGFDSDVRLPHTQLLLGVSQRFRALPQVAGFAFRILQADGVTEDAARWWHPVPLQQYATRSFFTSYFSGTAYAFRKSAMLEAGLYPEDLFMHYEEVELAFRILDNGGSIMYAPEFVVHHHEGKVSRRSQVTTFYRPRNQLLLAAGYLPWPRAIAYLAPRVPFQFFKALRHRHLRSYARAMTSACRLLPARLRERRPLKKETLRRMAALKTGAVN
jgi:GT2 family glycosyltransferase